MFPQACPSLFSIPVYSYHIFPLSLSLSSPLSHLPSPPLFLLLPCNSLLTHDPPCWVPPLGKYSLVSSFTFFSVRRYRAKILVNKILSYHRRWWRTVVSVGLMNDWPTQVSFFWKRTEQLWPGASAGEKSWLGRGSSAGSSGYGWGCQGV